MSNQHWMVALEGERADLVWAMATQSFELPMDGTAKGVLGERLAVAAVTYAYLLLEMEPLIPDTSGVDSARELEVLREHNTKVQKRFDAAKTAKAEWVGPEFKVGPHGVRVVYSRGSPKPKYLVALRENERIARC